MREDRPAWFTLALRSAKSDAMTINRDDSMITGEEFRIRRLALNLVQPIIQDFLGVQRSALDRWQQGRSKIPRRAREMLEMAEADVQAVVDDFLERHTQKVPAPEITALPSAMPEGWPWGEHTWFVALGRARFTLAETGSTHRLVTIGEPTEDAVDGFNRMQALRDEDMSVY